MLLSRSDWDNFETSWDFRDQPLLRSGDWGLEPGQTSGTWKGHTLAESWDNYAAYCSTAIHRMQELETENNRLWIDAYGLQDELTPEVPEKEITLARADAKKDVTAFLSYAVGCMMGRYSLDEPGLILADAGDTVENYLSKVGKGSGPLDPSRAIREPETVALAPNAQPECFACGTNLQTNKARFILADLYDREPDQVCGRPMIYCPSCAKDREDRLTLNQPLTQFSLTTALGSKWADPETIKTFLELANCFGHRRPSLVENLTFPPDEDAIVPVLDGEWFEDDIVARTREFLRVTFGEDTLNENLRFIEDSLGKPLRKYFLTDFYKDHLKTYKKRPIYWLVQSPGKSFQALIYLHRYTKDTMNLVLNNYLREFEAKLENRLDHLAHIITSESSSGPDKTKAQKETDKIKASLNELDAWEKDILFPIASQRIELDLDDGVKANYPKLGKTLAKIPGVSK